MSSIGSISSSNWSNTQALQGNRQARMQERMFQKADVDGSGGVDSTELQALLDKAAKKTGTSVDSSSATDLLSKSDSDKDGSLSSDELDSVMKSIFPPPTSTQDFLQSRGTGSTSSGDSTDDLFGKIDTDGSGGISKTELQSFTDQVKQDQGSSSTNGPSADDMMSKLDSDSSGELSQSELQAGRSSGKAHGHDGGMPAPPPGGMGGAGGTSQTSDSSSYDPLDTNKDGVVSEAERAASNSQATTLQDLFKSADSDSNDSLNGTELNKLVQQLTKQYSQIASVDFGNSSGSIINIAA